MQLTTDTGHSLDSYAFGILVGDILDCRMDLGEFFSIGKIMSMPYCHSYLFYLCPNWYITVDTD